MLKNDLIIKSSTSPATDNMKIFVLHQILRTAHNETKANEKTFMCNGYNLDGILYCQRLKPHDVKQFWE